MKARKHSHKTRPRKKTVRAVITYTLLFVLLLALLFAYEQTADAPVYQPAEPSPIQPEAQPNPAPETDQVPTPPAYSLSDPTSPWVVVNKQHPLEPVSYAPQDLVGIGSGQQARSMTASALAALLSSAAQSGNPMYVLSGYRSYDTQAAVYNNYVRADGQANADTYSARPGHSEHQTGLAVDIGNGTCNLLACFGDTSAGVWLANNAHAYGFIIRYPAGKSAITGYQYEPWHIRYVGVELATDMRTKQIQTLEEYFNIPGGTTY